VNTNTSQAVKDYVMHYVNVTAGMSSMVRSNGVQGYYTTTPGLGTNSPFVGGLNDSWTVINIDIMLNLQQGLTGDASVFAKALLKEAPKLSKRHLSHGVTAEVTGLLVRVRTPLSIPYSDSTCCLLLRLGFFRVAA
jgi:hypothetical protein